MYTPIDRFLCLLPRLPTWSPGLFLVGVLRGLAAPCGRLSGRTCLDLPAMRPVADMCGNGRDGLFLVPPSLGGVGLLAQWPAGAAASHRSRRQQGHQIDPWAAIGGGARQPPPAGRAVECLGGGGAAVLAGPDRLANQV